MKKLYLITALTLSNPLLSSTFEEYFNEGIRLVHQEKNLESVAALEKAAQLNPTHAQTYFNLGIIYKAMGNAEKAQENLEHALTYNPHYTKAYTNLGNLHASQNRFNQAIMCYQKVIDLGDASAQTHLELGRIYNALQDRTRSEEQFLKALSYDTNNVQVLFELGNMYTGQEKYIQATDCYKKILAMHPHLHEVAYNLAHVLRTQGNFQDSRAHYEHMIQASPNNAHALYGYAECCLALGDYEHGWQAFESRWKRDHNPRHFADKLWDGSSLCNKTIILRAEYGQGDTLQFIRYAPLLKEQGATVILEAQHSLITLLSHCPYLDRVIPVQEQSAHLPPHDYQVPIMSLPYYFKTRIETIPQNIPYIQIPTPLIAEWKQKLSNDTSFKIGICWEGSPYYEQFKSPYSKKSIPLATFAPVAALPNVHLYSLQKMNGTEQLQSLPQNMYVHDFGTNFDHDNGRFMDTAAVIEHMDLIITTDTSVAHLAGALGKPVWMLLPLVADWRWMVGRSDTPWYPSMRLFRQPEVGRWDIVLNTVAQELTTLLENKQVRIAKKPISVMTEVQIGELIDKITILQIKKERIKDAAKLKNIEAELNTLLETYTNDVPQIPGITQLWSALKNINEKLWAIEDDIRDKERARSFDQQFIDLARAVYYTNDERCRIKRDINMLTGSRLIEEKSYTAYA